MIKAVFYKKDGQYESFEFSGHALMDSYGKDIVCAAVSVLALNTVNSIEKFTTDKLRIEQNQEKGYLSGIFDKAPSQESTLLLDSLTFGLKNIASTYPKNLSIEIKED